MIRSFIGYFLTKGKGLILLFTQKAQTELLNRHENSLLLFLGIFIRMSEVYKKKERLMKNYPVKKNDVIEVEIIDLTHEGLGVAKVDHYPLFIENALPGEKLEIKVLKTGKSFGYGKVLTVLKSSEQRVPVKAPSGYSSKHGQTLNPYGPLKITPSGSSSGSGASVTMNIGAFSLGTETMGSIVSPASHQSVVGFKPTHSSVSGEGVLPLAPSLDTVGPIARSVVDAAQGYNAFKKDTVPSIDSTKFTKNNLQGQRIGLLEMPSAEEEFATAKKALQKAGAEVIPVTPDMEGIDGGKVISNEFKFALEEFAKRYDLPFKTLEELIAYNQQDKKVRAKYWQDLLEADVKKKQPDKEIIQTTIKKAQQTFDALLKKQQLDGYAFIDSEGTGLSAVAGYPELTVPLAKNSEGQHYGLTFTQTANKEQTLFEQAYSFEQSTKGRIVLSDNELLANSKKINRDEQ